LSQAIQQNHSLTSINLQGNNDISQDQCCVLAFHTYVRPTKLTVKLDHFNFEQGVERIRKIMSILKSVALPTNPFERFLNNPLYDKFIIIATHQPK